jgi:hypothetical protein
MVKCYKGVLKHDIKTLTSKILFISLIRVLDVDKLCSFFKK